MKHNCMPHPTATLPPFPPAAMNPPVAGSAALGLSSSTGDYYIRGPGVSSTVGSTGFTVNFPAGQTGPIPLELLARDDGVTEGREAVTLTIVTGDSSYFVSGMDGIGCVTIPVQELRPGSRGYVLWCGVVAPHTRRC
jgi:hypothetical protein